MKRLHRVDIYTSVTNIQIDTIPIPHVVTKFNLSSYITGEISGEEDIIELAVSLARINRLYGKGEIPEFDDYPLNKKQLELIQKILAGYHQDDTQLDNTTSFVLLKKKLQELNKDY